MQQQLKDVTENSDGMSTADYDDEEYFDCKYHSHLYF